MFTVTKGGNMKIRIGLPKEERLRNKTASVLEAISKEFTNESSPRCELTTIRTGDMYTDCLCRFVDIAILSTEVLVESSLQFSGQRIHLFDTCDSLTVVPFPIKPWWVANYTWKDRYFDNAFHTVGPGTSIASEFPLLTRHRYFFTDIYAFEGCVEARVAQKNIERPLCGMHAYGVGIVDSGKTLEEYNLKVIDWIMEVRPIWIFGTHLLRNPKPRKLIKKLLSLSGSSLGNAIEIERYNPNLKQFFS